MTTEQLIAIFQKQIDNKPKVYDNPEKKYSMNCHGNCPDLTTDDVPLYFVLVEAKYDEQLSAMKAAGNLLSLDKKITEINENTTTRLARVTLKYLDDPNCELYNYRHNKTLIESAFPVFSNLVR
jgi:hypothetical protein